MQFISEKEVEEIKERKQKEWENVRRPDQPLERPEEEIDNRTLYEKLKEQKDRKQEEFEEQFKFKNMIYKGLDDEEAVFLQAVADKQAKQDAEARDAERQELLAYRDAVEKLREEANPSSSSSSSSSSASASSTTASSGVSSGASAASTSSSRGGSTAPNKPHKSQLSLIAASIKTKRKRSSTDDSEVKTFPEKKPKIDTPSSPNSDKDRSIPSAASSAIPPPGISSSSALTGLTAYSSDSEDSND